MSKNFDLEPPKAPMAKKEKKGFLKKLFGSKEEESTLASIPEPKEKDIQALREKLGIGPVKTPAGDHLDALEQEANQDADDLSKQYDKEQQATPQEGSLDDALNEFSKEKGLAVPEQKETDTDSTSDAPLFIDPSLVDEHNQAEEEELKEEMGKNFDVTDFSADLDESEGDDDSVFAQEEISQSTQSRDEPNTDSPALAEDEDITPLAPEESTLAQDESQENNKIEEVEESPMAQEESSPENFQESTFANYDETPFAQEEDHEYQEQQSAHTFVDESEHETSSFTHDDDELVQQLEQPQESPLAQEIHDATQEEIYDEMQDAVEDGLEQEVELTQSQQGLEKEFEKEDLTAEVDVIAPLPVKEEKPAKKKSAKNTSTKEKEEQAAKQQAVEQERQAALEKEKKRLIEIEQTELDEQELAKVMQESQKAFDSYLKKEEKITKSFLTREQTLQKYLDSEKKNFVDVVAMQKLKPTENEAVLKAQETYEKKLQELYAKKYDAFSSWITKESELLKENLDSFKLEVAKEKKNIVSLKKEASESQKEYKSLTKKITLAEKRLVSKEAELVELEAAQTQKREELIDREVEVKAQESALEEQKQEVYKHIDEHNAILADVQRKIDEANNKLAEIKAQSKEAQKESSSLDTQLTKLKEQTKEKEKHLKDLDKKISQRQDELDKKDQLLAQLHKKEEKFIEEQKKSQEVLAQREEAVLDKINQNEKILRTIALKQEALKALEEKIETEGFQSYINAKLDQINPDQGVLSDEEHILDDSPELGSAIHKLMMECRKELQMQHFDQAKKLYAQVRQEYVDVDLAQEEKALLYAKIRELYDDINLAMLQARSDVRSVDVS